LSLEIGETGQWYFPILDVAGVNCVMQWIQSKHLRGHFQNLRNLEIISIEAFTQDCMDASLDAALFGAAILTAGFWSLQSCTLWGPFCLGTAAALLPRTLEELDLTKMGPPTVLRLSAFKRYDKLQSLTMGCTDDQ